MEEGRNNSICLGSLSFWLLLLLFVFIIDTPAYLVSIFCWFPSVVNSASIANNKTYLIKDRFHQNLKLVDFTPLQRNSPDPALTSALFQEVL